MSFLKQFTKSHSSKCGAKSPNKDRGTQTAAPALPAHKNEPSAVQDASNTSIKFQIAHPVGKKKARTLRSAPKPPKEDGGDVQPDQSDLT